MSEPKLAQKDTLGQDDNSIESDCLKCAKWDGGKGLEVLYRAGIRPAMLQAESVLRTTKDHIEMRQISSIVDYLQEMDEAIVGFQAELGVIEDSEETTA
jgi:hypothetical protein